MDIDVRDDSIGHVHIRHDWAPTCVPCTVDRKCVKDGGDGYKQRILRKELTWADPVTASVGHQNLVDA